MHKVLALILKIKDMMRQIRKGSIAAFSPDSPAETRLVGVPTGLDFYGGVPQTDKKKPAEIGPLLWNKITNKKPVRKIIEIKTTTANLGILR